MKFSIALKISSFFFSGIFSKSFTAAFVSSSKRFSSSFERCSEFFSFFSEDFCSRLSIHRASPLRQSSRDVPICPPTQISSPIALFVPLNSPVSFETLCGVCATSIWCPPGPPAASPRERFGYIPVVPEHTKDYVHDAREGEKTVCERAKNTPHIGPRPSRTL